MISMFNLSFHYKYRLLGVYGTFEKKSAVILSLIGEETQGEGRWSDLPRVPG